MTATNQSYIGVLFMKIKIENTKNLKNSIINKLKINQIL